MIIELPDHYIVNLAVAIVEIGVRVVERQRLVPAYLYQYADTWDHGIHYNSRMTYWEAVAEHSDVARNILRGQALL